MLWLWLMFAPPGSCAFLSVSHVSGWCCTFLYVSHFMFMREPYVLCLRWRASLWLCFTFLFTHALCLFMVHVIRRSSVCFTLRGNVLCSIFIGRVDASWCMIMFYTYAVCYILLFDVWRFLILGCVKCIPFCGNLFSRIVFCAEWKRGKGGLIAY